MDGVELDLETDTKENKRHKNSYLPTITQF